MSCHPSLDYKDPRHSPMLECKTCHNSLSDKMSACGSDCFSCHDAVKLSSGKEHKVVSSCIECHQTLNKNPFIKNTTNLKDFIRS